MFERILVAIENLQTEQTLCQAAISLARETGARLHWLHVIQDNQPLDNQPLLALHQQALTIFGLESDIAQIRGEFPQIIHDQLIKWGPDLLIIGHRHFRDISGMFFANNQQTSSGQQLACPVMMVPDPVPAGSQLGQPLNPVELATIAELQLKAQQLMLSA
jgi:nucleotide-binding universal stress UspA family protein